MIYFKKIQQKIENFFQNEIKIKELDNFENAQTVKMQIKKNEFYKCKVVVLACSIVDFKELKANTEKDIFVKIVLNFQHFVTEIIDKFNPLEISVANEFVYCTFSSLKNQEDIDRIFSLACYLSNFQDYFNNSINKHFKNKVKKDLYSFDNFEQNFKLGIGLALTKNNYFSFSNSLKKKILSLNESLIKAKKLAKLASRNWTDSILMNNYFYQNLTREQKKLVLEFGGFSTFTNEFLNDKVWQCNWKITNENNFPMFKSHF